MAAPASTERTYSLATSPMPLGVGLCGLRGNDMVESQVTVMISLSISVSLRLVA